MIYNLYYIFVEINLDAGLGARAFYRYIGHSTKLVLDNLGNLLRGLFPFSVFEKLTQF